MIKDKLIWFYRWSQICSGTIIEQQEDEQVGQYYYVHVNSIGGYETEGYTMCLINECYDTKEACLANLNCLVEQTVMKYKGNIPDVTALIEFCLTHTIFGEDCDLAARKAVMERAAELGFQISDATAF